MIRETTISSSEMLPDVEIIRRDNARYFLRSIRILSLLSRTSRIALNLLSLSNHHKPV